MPSPDQRCAFRRSNDPITVNVPSTGQARGVGEQDYEQHNPDHRGETARLTIPYRGFADRVEVDEIRVIV